MFRTALLVALISTFGAGSVLAQDARPTLSTFVQSTLNLAGGERATLTRSADGTYVLSETRRVEMDALLPPAGSTPANARGLLTTPQGTLSFALHARRDVGSLLRIENATDTGLRYVAYIRRVSGGQVTDPARTSVCTVPPGLVVFEHWREPVVQVIAGEFEAAEGEAPVCESHDVNQ